MSRTPLVRFTSALAVLLVLLPVGGCDLFLEDPTPDSVRLVLSGNSDATVEVLMSKEFLTARNEAGQTTIEVLVGDTLTVTPPFERTVDIREARQFFAQTRAADSVETTVRMRVFLDGEVRFDETRDLTTTPLRFVYLFNRPILADVDVL